MGLLNPIYDAVSWVMVAFHTLFTSAGLRADSGITWTLSIIGLVVVIRTLMIPLFVRQIHAQRGLQALQPRMREIQQKYKNDRDRQSQELMKLYQETGTNPLSSCLPLIIQTPIFFGLFHVLNAVSRTPDKPPGVFTRDLAESASNATIFGAPLSQTFLGAGTVVDKVIIGVLVIAMSALMFFTQRQLMSKNVPLAAGDGGSNPFAQQQKLMLYLMPVMFLVSGLGFPLGVLVYWVTSNIWTAAQQFIVIRRNPTPGSQAEADLARRRERRAAHQPPAVTTTTTTTAGSPAGQKRRGAAGGRAAAAGRAPAAGRAASEPVEPGPTPPSAAPGQRQQPKRTRRGERGKHPAPGATGGAAPGRGGGTAAKGASEPRRSGQSRPI
jgi:YidC/Oxa1 family membrane protein insertase